ncbi:Casein kinase II subunit beta-2 [Sphaceloma murrayae]|uniref:Casein kinase II subunit beta n=1 Tax=Sphaceloma murrayae TaxID=2082308 RepID=A0A2K1QXP4_9PEZI|nr:Casein kinase II subunit beta-2 [Sphaceloma murrayae]
MEDHMFHDRYPHDHPELDNIADEYYRRPGSTSPLPIRPAPTSGNAASSLSPPEPFRAAMLDIDSDGEVTWVSEFISSRGNEYFCEIDEDYLTDRFNLTGLNTEVQYYQYALDLITDVFDMEVDDDMRDQIEKSARHLYGLVHARYIVTTRGLAKMLDKFKNGVFGKCPRVICESQHLLPMGQHDVANVSNVKLYCAKCEDIYNPKSSRHNSIDGAYFGTSFQNILFQIYPAMLPQKTQRRYEPRIYGFRVHASAALMRWQEEQREDMKARLKARGVETGFEDEDNELEEESELDDEQGSQEGIDDMFEGKVVR